MKKNFLDWIGIYPYFRAPNLHCYEKICTITDNSIFIIISLPVSSQTTDKQKGIVWY